MSAQTEPSERSITFRRKSGRKGPVPGAKSKPILENMDPIHELWFTLLIGDTKIPVYLPYLDRDFRLPYMDAVARRPDESEDE
jgi:hypothetical protein